MPGLGAVKKRGRPRKKSIHEPGDQTSEDEREVPIVKKRGRPPKDKTNPEPAEEDVEGVESDIEHTLVNDKRYETRSQGKVRYEESEITEPEDEFGSARALPSIQQPSLFQDNDRPSMIDDLGSLPPVSSVGNPDDSWSFLSFSEYMVDSREHIQVYTGNVAYFVSSTGAPLDEGARVLQQQNKIPETVDMMVGEIHEHNRRNNRKYIAVCLHNEKENYSQHIKRVEIYRTLKVLRELLFRLKLKDICIARSKEICGFTFEEFLSIVNMVFMDGQIKFIICSGELEYVPLEKRDEIFKELHDSPIGGHRGVSKTYNRVRQKYYWENLKDDIQHRIQQCLNCKIKKLVRLKTRQPMVITDTPGMRFDKLALDIVGPLPKTELGNEYILTLQDQFSKFCMAIPLIETSVATVADMLIKRFICYFGSPRVILTDQGSNFMSALIKRISKRFKIKKIKTTAYHPQSNGSLERSHAMLGEFLKQYTNADDHWDQWVDLAMLNYNSCVQESTKYTPYELVFGRLPRLPSGDPLREGDLLPTYKGYLVDLIT